MLAYLNAVHIGAYGLELAANLRGRVRLQVKDVLVRGAAGQEDHDDGLVPGLLILRGLGAQQLRQGKPAHGETADLEEIAPRFAVAKTAMGEAWDGEHGREVVGKIRDTHPASCRSGKSHQPSNG